MQGKPQKRSAHLRINIEEKIVKFNKKSLVVTLSILVLAFINITNNAVLAFAPQDLYDTVWKLVDVKFVDAETNGQDWDKWRHKYDEYIKTDKDAYVAISTMLHSLNDPYTRFLDPEDFSDEKASIRGSLFGVGVQIGIKDDKLVVIAPIEDTPADRAGLIANDHILEVNGRATKGLSVKESAELIKGPKGTTVTLLIKRNDEEPKAYKIVRDKITLKAVSIKPPNKTKLSKNIGYIRLNSFLSSNASNELHKALKTLNEKDGFILDLRSNPGGLLTNAIRIADMFLKKKVIVSTVDREGYKSTQRSARNVLTQKPLVILIDGGSASASEILSGAIKDNGRGILVGQKSFGKGLVQEINKLPGGAGVNITIQKYLTPNGTDINKVGIVPDFEVKFTKKDIKNKNDVQLKKAEEVLKGLIKHQ